MFFAKSGLQKSIFYLALFQVRFYFSAALENLLLLWYTSVLIWLKDVIKRTIYVLFDELPKENSFFCKLYITH